MWVRVDTYWKPRPKPFPSSSPGWGGGRAARGSVGQPGTHPGVGRTAGNKTGMGLARWEHTVSQGTQGISKQELLTEVSSLRIMRIQTNSRQGSVRSTGCGRGGALWASRVCVRSWREAAANHAAVEPSSQGESQEWAWYLPEAEASEAEVDESGPEWWTMRSERQAQPWVCLHSKTLKNLSALLKRHPQKVTQKIQQWNDAAGNWLSRALWKDLFSL